MAPLSPILLFVLLLMSAAENQRKETNKERTIVVGTGPAKNDVVGTRLAKNDVVGSGDAVVGTGPAKIDVVGTGPTKNDVVGTGPAKNDVLAFSAQLSKTIERGPGSPIEFDQVLTNVGGLYFNTTGQFACANDGLYMFVWNLMKSSHSSSLDGMQCIGSLRIGGIDRKYGPKTSNYGNSNPSGVSEMMAIQECSSSTPTAVTITVQPWSESAGSTSIFYLNTTSFSGFKLNTSVAFTVELSKGQMVNPGSRIMFDKVIANYGETYDEINGFFRCPDAGVYVFNVATNTNNLVDLNGWTVSRLMMNTEVVMLGPMTYSTRYATDSGSASSTTVLQCTLGASVYVEAQLAYLYPSNSYTANLTSFTGFKMYDVTTETIAFTAVMSQNFTSTSTSAFEPVPFDEVITNIGNAFDTTAGHFVCPDDAYYLFTWTAVNYYHYAYMDLYMDDSLVKELHTTFAASLSDQAGTSGSCTQSVILQCQPGAKFQLRGKNEASSGIFLGGYTSFSGYKIPG